MVTKYILENEVGKHYANEKTNDYLLNGKHRKASELEKTVKNGTRVIKDSQMKSLLDLVSSYSFETVHQKVASTLRINLVDSVKVMKALDRNGYVSYNRNEKKCILTKKGKKLKGCKQ